MEEHLEKEKKFYSKKGLKNAAPPRFFILVHFLTESWLLFQIKSENNRTFSHFACLQKVR
jgi:hypothetical protein